MRFNIVTAKFEDTHTGGTKLAVAAADRDLTWKQLMQEAVALAARIRAVGLPLGHPIVVRGHKEADMVVSMVACMMLGHPYVPLDLVVPEERVRRILSISGSQLLIDLSAVPLQAGVPVLVPRCNDTLPPTIAATNGEYRAEDPVRYIIFTSGSTGEPKGVRITREAAASFLDWMCTDFGFTPADVFINQAPFSFDLSVYELFTSLHLGASLLLNDAATAKDSKRFIQRIGEYGGTVWVSTPTFAYLYLTEPAFREPDLPSVRAFLFCGEALPKATVGRLHDRFPAAHVLNTYGPTEATVATTLVQVTPTVLARYTDMPVGFPKKGSTIRVVTPSGAAATKEAPGEIEIIGPHVSIGYMGQSMLNAEKFFLVNGQRAFRTGDFGWFQDGMLFFSGRRDEQVKLNGYRIELGDISAQMLGVQGVADAIAVPLTAGDTVKRIIGFVRPMPGSVPNTLRPLVEAQLRRELPAYMVPADLMFVDAFPVNSSHKTDRAALIELYKKRAR
jgi:D-alanine--poly(phosphoribitol) ligase subunit 1